MLSELPSEIIYHIAVYLPTANALTHLAQTCRRLYQIVTAEDSRIFRAFVRSRFPSIRTPPFWKVAARILTSRSRALDRHAVIGRFILPPQNATRLDSHQATRRDNPTLGYRPALDSYEVWNGESWADRKEVLAWGAAAELIVRITQTGEHPQDDWLVFNDLDLVSSWDDICAVHLLGPDQYDKDPDKEHLIFGRVRGEIVHLAISARDRSYEYERRFMSYGLELTQTDLSDGTEPILAAHYDNDAIALYHTTTGKTDVEPFAWLHPDSQAAARTKYSKLLSPSLVAVGTGDVKNSLSISKVSEDSVVRYRDISVVLDAELGNSAKANVSAIAPLNSHALAGSPGDVFLAAWGDRAVRFVPFLHDEFHASILTYHITSRLHDLRSPNAYEATFRDTTDINPIYSLRALGHDRFLAGAGGDAVLKIFDLRMCNTYSYLDAQGPSTPSSLPSKRTPTTTNGAKPDIHANPPSNPRKDFSIFLSYNPPSTFPPRQNHARPRRRFPYRGPIYTMTSPSPSSSTVYTAIVDGVVRLDFASTDDLTGTSKEWYSYNLGLDLDTNAETSTKNRSPRTISSGEILDLSGYERPDPDDLCTVSKLRSQLPFRSISPRNLENECRTGWDRRWEPLTAEGAWRRWNT